MPAFFYHILVRDVNDCASLLSSTTGDGLPIDGTAIQLLIWPGCVIDGLPWLPMRIYNSFFLNIGDSSWPVPIPAMPPFCYF